METPLSVVDDLRIISLRTQNAAPAPGETPVIESVVLDANDAGYETWTWWCVHEDCGTGALPAVNFIELHGLVCVDCEGPGALNDVDSWLVDLEFETSSHAVKRTVMSPSPEMRVNGHPEVFVEAAPEVVAGEVLTLNVIFFDDLAGEWFVRGYSTAGSFAEVQEDPEGTEVLWTAPETRGDYEILIVGEDGLGGAETVTHPVTVI